MEFTTAFIGMGAGFHVTFLVIAVLGVVSLILTILIRPKHIDEIDEKYKADAGIHSVSHSASEMMGDK